MNIYLFGRTSLSGEAFYKVSNLGRIRINIYSFSRKNKSSFKLDLREPRSFSSIDNEKFKIISFAPIWDLSYFLNYLFNNQKDKLKNLDGIIACSSTSALTKRFESNNFDKNLSENLINSEKKLIEVCEKLKISCQIVRPTMIYGSVNGLEDKNISRILFFMRFFRFILLPSNSGLRQPIHATQLAEVIFYLLKKSYNKNKERSEIINLGGDEIFDFEEMIKHLKYSISKRDPARKCLIIKIPNRLFLISIIPVMFFSPKTFAALSRVCANLSGFKKACEITKTNPIKFPYSKN